MAYRSVGAGIRVTSVVVALAALPALACGLRTDPLFMGTPTGEGGSDSVGTGDVVIDPDRMGACAAPFEIPYENTTISGTLPEGHGSLYSGWCGGDAGPEDVYRFVPFYDSDVTFTFRSEATEIRPTLRVQVDPCGDSAGAVPMCATDVLENPVHFLARNGMAYWVTIDSRDEGVGGDYSFDVTIGDPGLGACPIHPETIEQSSGASFVWSNDFSNEGQGGVDGYCGGPGKENMFTLQASYAGGFYVRADTTGALSPVISFRTSCSALTELQCTSSLDTGVAGVAEMYGYIPGPGTYYLAIDSNDIGAGGYSLRVDFE